MFDIGFPELVLVAIVGLLVIGPERLPEALRTLGLWLGRMRRSFTSVKNEIEKEIGMDEVRRQLHNEAIMEEMKRIESEVRDTANDVRNTVNDTANSIHPNPSLKADADTEPRSDKDARQITSSDESSARPLAADSQAAAQTEIPLEDSQPADKSSKESETDKQTARVNNG